MLEQAKLVKASLSWLLDSGKYGIRGVRGPMAGGPPDSTEEVVCAEVSAKQESSGTRKAAS